MAGKRGAGTGRRGRPRVNRVEREESEPSVHGSVSIHTASENAPSNPGTHDEEGLVLEPIVRKAIGDEVTAVLKSNLPATLTEALKTVEEEKGRGLRAENRNVIETESENDDSDYDEKRGCDY
ncbi:hypothetical protein L1987_17468 [Smallanthus sonchifolius]|uniref:Uncharacterized protein n=1 Tax=Smallanthus sonchifolius TaxID=185202 RepID=A0ACB9IZ15_9ASTR|nr:hypothetical protein L1987_17468 [Smallanthus sonchifolius]